MLLQKGAMANVYKGPVKHTRHFDAQYRSFGVYDMFLTFGHPVATCCKILNEAKRVKLVLRSNVDI